MKIIDTSTALPKDMSPFEREMVYNGMDCCVTAEVLNVILPQLDNLTGATYAFSRALQGPALEMRLRGVRIDHNRKAEVIDEFIEKINWLEQRLDALAIDGAGMINFSYRSTKDVQKLFYEQLGIPVIRRGGQPTVDRNALERMGSYIVARPFVNHLILMRELEKKIQVLRTEIDPDGRLRTSYNIAGTNTGRFSSSFSEFGTGGNLQNIEESLRSIFIADKGMKLAKFDAKSGESFVVGAIEWNLFHDDKYLSACESGDPHTATARICWPQLGWTGDLKRDKILAERPYYRHHSYRFMCKKLGHGSNYGGKPDTLAQQSQLPVSVVQDFQPKYFKAFPAHLQWQAWVDRTIRKEGRLISLTGRRRDFWGRRTEDSTLREAIAFDPQGSLADIVNTAMLEIFRARPATLYMHDHDALTVQYPEETEDEVIPQVQKLLEVTIELKHGRTLLIPFDCKVGFNRGEYNEKTNPDGLKDWYPGDKRRRQAEAGILDRKLR